MQGGVLFLGAQLSERLSAWSQVQLALLGLGVLVTETGEASY